MTSQLVPDVLSISGQWLQEMELPALIEEHLALGDEPDVEVDVEEED